MEAFIVFVPFFIEQGRDRSVRGSGRLGLGEP
jgi:hypothetical protein